MWFYMEPMEISKMMTQISICLYPVSVLCPATRALLSYRTSSRSDTADIEVLDLTLDMSYMFQHDFLLWD